MLISLLSLDAHSRLTSNQSGWSILPDKCILDKELYVSLIIQVCPVINRDSREPPRQSIWAGRQVENAGRALMVMLSEAGCCACTDTSPARDSSKMESRYIIAVVC